MEGVEKLGGEGSGEAAEEFDRPEAAHGRGEERTRENPHSVQKLVPALY